MDGPKGLGVTWKKLFTYRMFQGYCMKFEPGFLAHLLPALQLVSDIPLRGIFLLGNGGSLIGIRTFFRAYFGYMTVSVVKMANIMNVATLSRVVRLSAVVATNILRMLSLDSSNFCRRRSSSSTEFQHITCSRFHT